MKCKLKWQWNIILQVFEWQQLESCILLSTEEDIGSGYFCTAGMGINCTITLEGNHIHSNPTYRYIFPENQQKFEWWHIHGCFSIINRNKELDASERSKN